MKTLLTVITACLIIFSSCAKTDMQSPVQAKQSSENTIAKQSNFDLLTAHPWKYKKLVFFYHDDTDSGKIVYQRGADNNMYPYNTNRVYFYKDGTYDYKNEYGYHYPAKWEFAAGSHQTIVHIYYAENQQTYYTIKLLDQKHYNVTYTTYDHRYAEFIPASQ